MIPFEKTHIYLGEKNEHEECSVDFKYNCDPENILEIKPTCGCTKYEHLKEEQTIRVFFNTEEVPKHLLEQGYFEPDKLVNVVYKTEVQLSAGMKVLGKNYKQ